MLKIDLVGGEVLQPSGLETARLSTADGVVVDAPTGRSVDLSGYRILPGIIDAHGATKQ